MPLSHSSKLKASSPSSSVPPTRIGFQVIKGEIELTPLDQNALVISQGWPSWSFALDGLGFASISTLANFRSLSSRDEFRHTTLGSTLLHHDNWNDWLTRHSDNGIIFVQGDRAFLESIFLRCESFDSLRLVYCCSDPDFWTADGWRESHTTAGGVTDGSWTFYKQNLLLSSAVIPPIRRSLRHVLRTTESASSARSLARCQSAISSPDDCVCWNDKLPSVETYSVYTKDIPVKRLITEDELLDIYDLELGVQAELKSYWNRSGMTSTRSYVDQVPVKVLRAVAMRVVKGISSTNSATLPCDSGSVTSSIDSNETFQMSNCQAASNVIDGSLESDSDSGSIAAELRVDDSSVDQTDSDKAAKEDDAEAVSEDWDRWTVENFNFDSSSSTPVICTGVYDSATHQPFFDSLRGLMIRRYRKNVMLSFVRYLKSEYYGNHLGDLRLRDLFEERMGGGKSLDFDLSTLPEVVRVPRWTVNRYKLQSSRKKKQQLEELKKDLEVGRDAVGRAANASWWNWDAGSTLFFWRWPKWSKKSVRDGITLFVDWKRMPSFWKRQQWPTEPHAIAKLKKKLANVRAKQYVQPGFVKSLTSYFAVPKAKTDIRVVYDATACGLNDCLWAPNFFLPTVDTILRNASSSTWFGDIDLGEMFLNYPLDEAIRPYAGVDVTNVDVDESKEKGIKRVIERWARCLMGFKPSPFVTTQTFGWGEEIIVGDISDPSNPFAWDTVELNLPGTSNYDPSMPWVYRWNSAEQKMASFFGTYIDDIRGGGPSEIDCRRSIHRAACRINYLGQQDAPRKRGQATQTPRAWAGSKCMAIEGEGLYVLSMEGKWKKAKDIIRKIYDLVSKEKQSSLDYKMLECDVGFLCHVSRTYPIIFPYLKGFYNTMNNWRCDRDKEGWKISKTAWMELLAGDVSFENEGDIELSFEDRKRSFMKMQSTQHPDKVPIVPRLERDLSALNELFAPEKPTLRLVRGHAIQFALFGFGDASGGGFGSSWEKAGKVSYRFGTWGEDMDGESSNLRELTNLVDTLDEMGIQGALKGAEIFLFTDNSTSEAAYYNGSSKSEKLFDLVLRVKKLEMHRQAKIHIIHVSGERMKEQGSDGLSRGNLNVGVMAGKRMIDFVPIHLTAFERSATLEPWLKTFIGESAEILEPRDWFRRGHDLVESSWEINSDGMKLPIVRQGTYIWAPQPCAAETAVEQLRMARHKRQMSKHLFIVPRLMSPTWRKHLHKAADLILTLKPGHKAWPCCMLEPLTLAFVFPFIRHKPWQLRGSVQLLALGRELSRVWSTDAGGEGPLLRELWSYQERLESLPSKLASKLLFSESINFVSHCNPRKRRRGKMEKEEGGKEISKRKKG
jgi:hypothetical protein